MTVRRIVKKPLPRLNGVNKIEVKESTTVLGVQELPNMEDPIQLLLVEEVAPVGKVDESTKTIEILLINDQMAFSDPGENKALQYIGTVVWDKGYRVHHAFEVEDAPDFSQVIEQLQQEDPGFMEAVNTVGFSEDGIELKPEPEPAPELPKGTTVTIKSVED